MDLAAVSGGAAGDKKIDSVIVFGKPGDDTLKIASVGSAIVTTGMAAEVSVVHADKTDILTINGGVGGDTIDASKLAAGKVALELGGRQRQRFHLTGSAGNDVITGGFGNDLASLGAGNDVFVWDTGNADDTIDGQAGTDTLQFNASDSSESFEVICQRRPRAGGPQCRRHHSWTSKMSSRIELARFGRRR